MAILFNPADWYWAVAGSSTQVYSSARNIYVPLADSDYVKWLTTHMIGSIATEAEIWPYVSVVPRSLPSWLFNGTSFAQPALNAYTKGQLAGYNADARWRAETAGAVCAGVPLRTDRLSQSQRDATYTYFALVPGATVQWKLPDGTFMTLDQATLDDQMKDTAGYVQDCFTCEKQTLDGITAGTITTLAQIDAAFAAIPTER